MPKHFEFVFRSETSESKYITNNSNFFIYFFKYKAVILSLCIPVTPLFCLFNDWLVN